MCVRITRPPEGDTVRGARSARARDREPMEWEEALVWGLAIGLTVILLLGFCWIAWPSANRNGGVCKNCKCDRLCASCTGCGTGVCTAAVACCSAAFRCCGSTAREVERTADRVAPKPSDGVPVAQKLAEPSDAEPERVIQAVPTGYSMNERVVGVHDDCYGCYSSFCLDCGVLNRVCCQCTWLSSWREPATAATRALDEEAPAAAPPLAPVVVRGVPVGPAEPAEPQAVDDRLAALSKRLQRLAAASEEALPLLALPLSR